MMVVMMLLNKHRPGPPTAVATSSRETDIGIVGLGASWDVFTDR